MKASTVAALGALAAIAGGGVVWATDRAPYPYSQRWILDLPLPLLTPTRLAALLRPRPGERLLEIGAGTGLHTLHVAAMLEGRGRLDALDVQPGMLAHLARRAARRGITTITTHLGDAASLPFPDRHFDAAFLVTVLGETDNPGRVLAELSRVLRPHARLVVGEFADRHYVSLTSLIREANHVGLHFTGRLGVPFAYYAAFQPCPDPVPTAPSEVP